jgi:tRNA threonylcarbamoyladenosine biosynthesis protein TsaE
MKKEFLTKNQKETQKLGEKIAEQILKKAKKSKMAIIIGLKGDLGGGKTTFVQGFAKGLGVKEKILSPTFVILKKFSVKGGFLLYHIDCYRLKSGKDILSLGLKEIISNPNNIIVIEWPEKLKKILKKPEIISFVFVDKKTRRITCG